MNEIRLRAWHKTRKNMVTGLTIPLLAGHEPQKLRSHPDEYVWMLAIGVTDKHGIEIYEGDKVICNRYASGEDYEVLIEDIRNLPRELFGSSLNFREIVGNIYQPHNEKSST